MNELRITNYELRIKIFVTGMLSAYLEFNNQQRGKRQEDKMAF